MANSMQIKSNKEVRDYKEVVYFGMTIRQLLFTGLAGARRWGCISSATAACPWKW